MNHAVLLVRRLRLQLGVETNEQVTPRVLKALNEGRVVKTHIPQPVLAAEEASRAPLRSFVAERAHRQSSELK